MTDKEDEALTISNPRLLSAIYFGLLAVIANIIIDSVLYAVGVQELLPFFQAVFLAVIIAAPFGALFGKQIVHCKKPYTGKVFWLGFLMVLAALPFHSLGFLYFFQGTHPQVFSNASFFDLIKIFLLVLSYSVVLFGLGLAVFGGLAAVYLRGHLVYHMLNALYTRRKKTEQNETVIKPKTAKYGQATIEVDNKKDDA